MMFVGTSATAEATWNQSIVLHERVLLAEKNRRELSKQVEMSR
jgi:hypothetical protein